jgi:hypothetical protein
MAAFFTREKANEGIELPLSFPDGTPSPHWIRVRGMDSDAFKAADAQAKRRMFEIAGEPDKAKIEAFLAEAKVNSIGSLVISWSFPEKCTPEAVKAFLKEAPQIADQIDRIASKRSLFFRNGSSNSSPSPGPSST